MPDGVRENKKRETRERIAEAGLGLFVTRGYDATTIDAITQAAGISRRLFFYYFKTKDDVLLAWHGAGQVSRALAPVVRQASPSDVPIDVVRRELIELASRYETGESKTVDGLLRSTESLRSRKDAIYIEMERDLSLAMADVWSDTSRQHELRLVAMLAIGTLRLALDAWREDGSGGALADHVRVQFELLDGQIQRVHR